MTFSDSEINLNAASLFSNVFFLLSFFHSFNKQHRADENMIITWPNKNKIKVKIQCNVFLPHALLTCCQFQRLKYSLCPGVYADDLSFT